MPTENCKDLDFWQGVNDIVNVQAKTSAAEFDRSVSNNDDQAVNKCDAVCVLSAFCMKAGI